jgi:hypothetical protein
MNIFRHLFPSYKVSSCFQFSAFILAASVFSTSTFSQTTTIVDTTTSKTSAVIIAGKQYKKSGFHDWLWGKHYRQEWVTPVRVKAINIDTTFGGLKPLQKGGGRQTRTLRLEDKSGKQYVLRSIDKTYTRALPKLFTGTFVESIANDQVSIAHPYSALTVPLLAEAAKVYHTNPQIVFLPDNANLGEFREEFRNQLYLFEERPAGFQGDAENFGNSEDVDGTEKMLRKIYEENDHRVDQVAFIRARLFDMFLSDWGRHEDQWRWATFKEEGNKIYRPIPRDRDQAYTKFDGLLVGVGSQAAKLVYLQSVDYTIKNIGGYNFQARHLDRQLANEPTLKVWMDIARELQQLLTNNIIDNALKQLPPEVYNISGVELASKLKARRDHLVEFADKYYHILSSEVDVVGTKKSELFEVTGISDDEVKVDVYDLDSTGKRKPKPFYSRNFLASETREVRLYGVNGKDQFNVTGNTSKNIELRFIGGPKKDSFSVPASFNGKIKVYDDKDNEFNTSGNTKMHLSNDTAIHKFEYDAFKPDFSGIKPGISYNNEDRWFVSFGYRMQRQQWRKSPFGYQADLYVNYSLTQNAFSFGSEGVYNKVFGKWNLGVLAQYDLVRDQHFAGIGNNAELTSDAPNFHRYRNKEVDVQLSLFRNFGTRHTLTFTGFYQMVEVLPNEGRFISTVYAPLHKSVFNRDNFAGVKADYRFSSVNDKLFPTKGVAFSTGVEFTQNVKKTDRNVMRFSGIFGFYAPIAPSLTLAVKTGAATLSGEPEFYQLNRLGGGRTLRGFLRYRFYGKTAVYNQNELQWNFNVKTYFFSGKMGLLALVDDGRVWMPGEVSDKWHVGVGGGIMIAPFNKISLTGTYTKSNEDNRFNVRLGKLL